MTWFMLALASAAFSAAAAVMQKRTLFRIDALRFSVFLSYAILLLTLPLFAFISYAEVSPTALALLFGKTLLGAGAFLSVMHAIRENELSEALPLMTLTPGLVAVLAFIGLGEALSTGEVVGLVLLLVGAYLVELRRSEGLLHPFTVFVRSRRHLPIVIALLLFTVTAVLDRYLLTDLQLRPLPMLAFQNLFLSFHLTLFLLYRRGAASLRPGAELRPLLPWMLGIAVCTMAYRFAQIAAVSMAPVSLVLSIKRLSVLMASLAGGRMFRERDLGRKSLAIVLLLAGVWLLVR